MNGEKDTDVVNDVEDIEENAAPDDTVVLTEDLEDIGDVADTAELNVEKLVEKIDKVDDADHKKEVHRRLEELAEKKREEAELDSTYNFNLDDEI
jgi:GTP-binding protein EngB required for normal cell division